MAWSSPVPVGTRIGSNFGNRGGSLHAGDDYPPAKPGQQGVPFFAIGDGTVIGVGAGLLKGHSGRHNLLIQHPGNILSYYGHSNKMPLKVGQKVKGGQELSDMGYDGNTIPDGPGGTHLHLGVIVNGRFVDPSEFLASKGITVGKTAPVKPSKTSKPTGKNYPDVELVEDGRWLSKTTKALQLVLPKKYNGNKNLREDGDFGTTSIKATQRWLKDLGYYTRPVDGIWGRRSKMALQAFLYDKGLYRNGNYSKAVMVDGDFTVRSVKAFQKYLNSQRKYLV